jgi:hypothetical protein
MTEPNPNPTTRMPVPEPAEPEGVAGSASSTTTTATEADWGATPPVPPAAPPAAPPIPPLPPFARPPRRDDMDRGRSASILFGLVILGFGLWFFVEHTLGYQLPRIRWNQVWPVFIIGVGVWVVWGSLRRGSR